MLHIFLCSWIKLKDSYKVRGKFHHSILTYMCYDTLFKFAPLLHFSFFGAGSLLLDSGAFLAGVYTWTSYSNQFSPGYSQSRNPKREVKALWSFLLWPWKPSASPPPHSTGFMQVLVFLRTWNHIVKPPCLPHSSNVLLLHSSVYIICVCIMCVCVCVMYVCERRCGNATAHMWRAEKNFWELVFSFQWVPEIRSSGLNHPLVQCPYLREKEAEAQRLSSHHQAIRRGGIWSSLPPETMALT